MSDLEAQLSQFDAEQHVLISIMLEAFVERAFLQDGLTNKEVAGVDIIEWRLISLCGVAIACVCGLVDVAQIMREEGVLSQGFLSYSVASIVAVSGSGGYEFGV